MSKKVKRTWEAGTCPKLSKYHFARKKMKNFTHQYENVFMGKEALQQTNAFWNQIIIRKPIRFKSTYMSMWQDLLKSYNDFVWDAMTKYVYLYGKADFYKMVNEKNFEVGRDGVERRKIRNLFNVGEGVSTEDVRAFRLGLNLLTGGNILTISKPPVHNALVSYIRDLYDIDRISPYLEKNKELYKYPYKHMDISCLYLVHVMPERYDLLKHWEEQGYNAMEFIEYVINYISCWNEKYGKTYNLMRRQINNYLWSVEYVSGKNPNAKWKYNPEYYT